MNILLDECVPRPLARYLEGHQVQTVPQAGWANHLSANVAFTMAETSSCVALARSWVTLSFAS